MTSTDEFQLIQAFLAAKRGSTTAAQNNAWYEFFTIHDRAIRRLVKSRKTTLLDVDEVSQDVWCLLIQRIPKLVFDPERGTVLAWVLTVAVQFAGKQARGLARRRHGVGLAVSSLGWPCGDSLEASGDSVRQVPDFVG